MNCTLETWPILCCVMLLEDTFKLCSIIRDSLWRYRLCARVSESLKIVNARSLEMRISSSSRYFNVGVSIGKNWIDSWLKFTLTFRTYSVKPRMILLRVLL